MGHVIRLRGWRVSFSEPWQFADRCTRTARANFWRIPGWLAKRPARFASARPGALLGGPFPWNAGPGRTPFGLVTRNAQHSWTGTQTGSDGLLSGGPPRRTQDPPSAGVSRRQCWPGDALRNPLDG